MRGVTHSDTSSADRTPARVRAALAAVRTRAFAFRRRHPFLVGISLVLVLILVLVLGDIGLMSSRLDRTELHMPRTATDGTSSTDGTDNTAAPDDETWLIVGTDSRENLPEGPDRYGTVEDTGGGSRADVLALVRPTANGFTILTLPRDLTVGPTLFTRQRLATSYLDGAQNTVDLLCTQLGITTTHLITVDMAQFASIIDSLGGLEVTIDEPFRDANAGLDIAQAGPQTLSGVDALALVRSRHPEVYRDGAWVALSETEGAHRRTQNSGVVMKALMSAMRERARNPLTAHQLAWTLTGNLGVDDETGLLDLTHLISTMARAGTDAVTLVDVPAPTQGDSFVAFPTDETFAVLAEYGYTPGACAPAD